VVDGGVSVVVGMGAGVMVVTDFGGFDSNGESKTIITAASRNDHGSHAEWLAVPPRP